MGYSQQLSNFRSKSIQVSQDTITIDTLSIAPGTFTLKHNQTVVPDSLYHLDLWSSRLILYKPLTEKYDLFTATYRVFPKSFSKSYFENQLKDIKKIPDEVFTYEKLQSQKERQRSSPFNPNNIIQSGSIGRGLTVGNNQDVSVNSTLNLQLSGKLSDNLNIAGVISDDNIPLEPDGTTQEIKQLDKVYMKVYNDQTQLTGGDFEIENTTGRYLDFQRKVKGGEIKHSFDLSDSKQLQSSLAGAISKGKYCIKSFSGQEGNQGPYRLTGCEGESHITVLAGSERVYIDGERMKRGQQNDYTIQYNTAELTFTANQPITKDKRIKVEFEYAIRSFARFSVFSKNEVKTQSGNFWINFYSESDAKNQPLAQELSNERKKLLANAGDQLDQAVVPYVDTVEYDNDRILYKKTDTTVNGQTFQIFQYSTNPELAKYEVGFSFTGQGAGNYVIAKSAANGRVYKWVAPKNGTPQGKYSPVKRLSPPVKHQILQAGGITHIDSFTTASYDLAFSNNDINTFSSKDQQDNKGYAVRLNIGRDFQFTDTTQNQISANLHYRGRHENFQPVGRIRAIEFNRNWNIRGQGFSSDEHLLKGSLSYSGKNFGKANYQFETLHYPGKYEGFKNQISTRIEKGRFNIDLWGNILNTNSSKSNTRFIRYKADISRSFNHFKVGVKPEGEHNRWKNTASDTLSPNSFAFSSWEFYVSSPDTATNNYFASYKLRDDFAPFTDKLKQITSAKDINLGYNIRSIPNHSLQSIVTYRELNITDTAGIELKPEENLTGRIQHRGRWLKSLLSSSTFWEIGSGLEPKKEFTYIEVPPGQGVYTWSDYNSNNVKELNEFEEANFQDEAKYIRVYRPSGEYIKTRHNEFNQTLNIYPDKVLKKDSGLVNMVRKLSNQTSYNMRRKTQNTGLWDNANPFNHSFRDTNIISKSTNIRNKLTFNRTNPVYQIHYIYLQSKNKSSMVNGMESHEARKHSLQVHWNISNNLSLINKTSQGRKIQTSEYFKNTDYSIKSYQNDITMRYNPVSSIRWELDYIFKNKNNKQGKEQTTKHNIGTSLRWSRLKSFNLQLGADFIYFKYPFSENTPIAYEMLEGLKPGKNATWNVTFQKDIYKNLQLNFRYSGRISENSKAIHTGQFELRANF